MSLLFLLLAVLTSTFTEFCKTSIVFLPFSHHCYILEDNLQYTEGKKKKKSISFVDCLCVSERQLIFNSELEVTKCKRAKERIAEVTLTLSQPIRFRIQVSLKLLHYEPDFHQADKKWSFGGSFVFSIQLLTK